MGFACYDDVVGGVTINVENENEVFAALDIIQTQIMDNMGSEHDELVVKFSDFMDEVEKLYPDVDLDSVEVW